MLMTEKPPSAASVKRAEAQRNAKVREKAMARLHPCVEDPVGWNRLRYKAFVRYGNHCQCCGRGPEDGAKLEVDHIRPVSKFPALRYSLDNLQILCQVCNSGKSDWDMTCWR